jgi:hypothetical protein
MPVPEYIDWDPFESLNWGDGYHGIADDFGWGEDWLHDELPDEDGGPDDDRDSECPQEDVSHRSWEDEDFENETDVWFAEIERRLEARDDRRAKRWYPPRHVSVRV